MPRVTYITPAGDQHEVEVDVGMSVMEGAVMNMIDGIAAVCGGECICATCHVHVEATWFEKTGIRNETEAEMLDVVAHSCDTSRLACQVTVTDELDGLIVRIPEGNE